MHQVQDLTSSTVAVESRSTSAVVAALARMLDGIDRVLVVACVLATIAAGLVLTYSVIVRYSFRWSTDWQDEMAVFCLVGATFLSAPYVQAMRGHIGIEAVISLLPPRVDRWRRLLVSIICLAFCAVFAHQCWLLLMEAIESGEVTDSAWAPPLWIPYSFMTTGIILLTLRFAVQTVQHLLECVEAPR